MTTSRLLVASAAVSSALVFGLPSVLHAQHVSRVQQPVKRVASLAPGTIEGIVRDEAGDPVGGAIISALGNTATFAFSDQDGRFQLGSLPPGPYLIRAYLKGYQAPRPEMIEVRASGRSVSAIALRKVGAAPAVLTAGVGVETAPEAFQSPAPRSTDEGENVGKVESSDSSDRDDSETAWRIRHSRRGVLRNATAIADWMPDSWSGASWLGQADALGRAVARPALIASSYFTDTPFTGEINFLTTGVFGRPDEPGTVGFSRGVGGVAHAILSAPAGENGDWTVSGAMTQADIAAWIVAGSYVAHTGSHRYDVGVSYAAQRYQGGNPLALRGVADVTRNAGTIYGFDTVTLTPEVSVSYGARYARYDYLEERALISPRVEMTVTPADGLRLALALSRWAHAPGAEEFLPPGDTGIWLPPQRTFSSFAPQSKPLDAERAMQVALRLERDIAGSTISIRAFRQHVDGQLLTLFGADKADQPVAALGHYFVGNVGDVDASGGTAELRTAFAKRVQGSVSYTLTRARLDPDSDLSALLLMAGARPGVILPDVDRIHDVSTTIEADVPETATRVLVVYRASNGFAAPRPDSDDGDRFAYRFDVQVRQALPFMSFSHAKWEMLVALRNFFREATDDQSVYGELLVVRPPKRIVGGVTLHF